MPVGFDVGCWGDGVPLARNCIIVSLESFDRPLLLTSEFVHFDLPRPDGLMPFITTSLRGSWAGRSLINRPARYKTNTPLPTTSHYRPDVPVNRRSYASEETLPACIAIGIESDQCCCDALPGLPMQNGFASIKICLWWSNSKISRRVTGSQNNRFALQGITMGSSTLDRIAVENKTKNLYWNELHPGTSGLFRVTQPQVFGNLFVPMCGDVHRTGFHLSRHALPEFQGHDYITPLFRSCVEFAIRICSGLLPKASSIRD